jgi:hypothetical protein
MIFLLSLNKKKLQVLDFEKQRKNMLHEHFWMVENEKMK